MINDSNNSSSPPSSASSSSPIIILQSPASTSSGVTTSSPSLLKSSEKTTIDSNNNNSSTNEESMVESNFLLSKATMNCKKQLEFGTKEDKNNDNVQNNEVLDDLRENSEGDLIIDEDNSLNSNKTDLSFCSCLSNDNENDDEERNNGDNSNDNNNNSQTRQQIFNKSVLFCLCRICGKTRQIDTIKPVSDSSAISYVTNDVNKKEDNDDNNQNDNQKQLEVLSDRSLTTSMNTSIPDDNQQEKNCNPNNNNNNNNEDQNKIINNSSISLFDTGGNSSKLSTNTNLNSCTKDNSALNTTTTTNNNNKSSNISTSQTQSTSTTLTLSNSSSTSENNLSNNNNNNNKTLANDKSQTTIIINPKQSRVIVNNRSSNENTTTSNSINENSLIINNCSNITTQQPQSISNNKRTSSIVQSQQQLLLNIKVEPESPPPSLPITGNNTANHPQHHSSSNSSPLFNTNTNNSNIKTSSNNNSPSSLSSSSSNNSIKNNTRSSNNDTTMLVSSGPLTGTPNAPNNHIMEYHQQPPPPSLHAGNGAHQSHATHSHQTQMNNGGHGHPVMTGPPQTMLPMLTNSNQQPTISVSAVVTAASSSPNSDPKDCIEELCPVCGDRVSGYHYGLLTCESCKGFFKRTVQNKKVYTCVADRNCHIDKSQRKRCPYCRFQKCLDVGMKLEAVRADRMRGGRNKFGPMYKRDRARRLQLLRQKQLAKAHQVNVGGVVHGNGSSLIPGSSANEALNFLNTAPGSHGSIFDGVKPELIQIPQLSSSTSSPDSSPSPGSSAAAASAVAVAGQLANSAAASAVQHIISPLVPTNLQTSNLANSLPPSLMNPNTSEHVLKWNQTGPGPSNMNNSGPSGKTGGLQHSQQHYDVKISIPPLIRELQMSMTDDKEWQSQLFSLLQNQTYNQCEVDLFELMCKVIDQSLFAQVDWARNSIFFKDLKVDDQMKLLQHAWSDMLVLDHIHQRLHAGLPDETTLPNGQKFDLLSLALLGVPQVADQLHRVSTRLQELKVDTNDYICLKFLLLLNPEVRGLTNLKLVHDAHEQTKQALLDYCINFYPQITDKFNQLLALVPEIHTLTVRGEDFLYYKHMNGSAPTQTLLMEMLHAKKK